MKFHVKFLFGIIASVLCLCDAGAETKPCPEGCFCLNGGVTLYNDGLYCKYSAKPFLSTNNGGAYYKYYDGVGVVSDKKTYVGEFDYYLDDFTEFYDSKYGFYGFKKEGGFVTINDVDMQGRKYDNIFSCPTEYPKSASGAKGLTECFKYNEKGQKEYYKAPTNTQNGSSGNPNIDIGTVNALVKDLQSALSKAQALQNALDKVEQTNTANTESAKAAINAGITDSAAKNQKKDFKSNSSNKDIKDIKSLDADVEQVKKLIRAGVSDESLKGPAVSAKKTRK